MHVYERDIHTHKLTAKVREKERLRETKTLQEIKAESERKRECETEREIASEVVVEMIVSCHLVQLVWILVEKVYELYH